MNDKQKALATQAGIAAVSVALTLGIVAVSGDDAKPHAVVSSSARQTASKPIPPRYPDSPCKAQDGFYDSLDVVPAPGCMVVMGTSKTAALECGTERTKAFVRALDETRIVVTDCRMAEVE